MSRYLIKIAIVAVIAAVAATVVQKMLFEGSNTAVTAGVAGAIAGVVAVGGGRRKKG